MSGAAAAAAAAAAARLYPWVRYSNLAGETSSYPLHADSCPPLAPRPACRLSLSGYEDFVGASLDEGTLSFFLPILVHM
jgi:hypothetical protein